MGKIWVEICLISARGLRRTSAFFKLRWYAVGWIDSKSKYCTRSDACGNANPVWKTKFSALVDDSETNSENLALQVEVYSRDPIFLRERLQGTATVFLKEFLDKFEKNSEGYKPVQEVGSFQLRKKNSNKPKGFVDISVRVSTEKEDSDIYTGDNGGIKLIDYNNHINPPTNQYGTLQASHPYYPPPPFYHLENRPPSTNPVYGSTYPSSSQAGPSYTSSCRPSYPPPQTPPPQQPPYNMGCVPTFPSRTNNYHNLPPSYMSMPPDGAGRGNGTGRGNGAGLGMGLGTGTLAAGAVIFGDDFMSSFSVPSGLHNPSLTVATNPPF